jgi:hypothetical protein
MTTIHVPAPPGWYICLLLLLLCGCDCIPRVRAYQARATSRCEQKYTAEQCKPLSYPSTTPGPFGGVQTQR